MGQLLNELYAQNFTLQCENKALRHKIDEFKNGKRYRKLQDGHERVVAGYKQEIRRLTKELRRNWRKGPNVSGNLKPSTGKRFGNTTKSFWALRKDTLGS